MKYGKSYNDRWGRNPVRCKRGSYKKVFNDLTARYGDPMAAPKTERSRLFAAGCIGLEA